MINTELNAVGGSECRIEYGCGVSTVAELSELIRGQAQLPDIARTLRDPGKVWLTCQPSLIESSW
jgi:hypothetical protein